MAKQQLSSVTRGIGQLMQERRYFSVPEHQRDFAWPVGAVEQYFDDVTGAMSNGDDDYFLGLIVLVTPDSPEGKRYEILDGQQRLATTTMFYAALRDWFSSNAFAKESTKIQSEVIGIAEFGEANDEPRLVLNLNNRALFDETVVNSVKSDELAKRQDEAGRYSSNRKLLDATIRCRELIAKFAEDKGPDQTKQFNALVELAKYLRDNVQVNCLDVAAPENAYMIFEALNDRGIDLSVLDLLKNHLFRESGSNNHAQVQHSWSTMMSRLGDRRADDFLKAFWTSRYGRIQRGRLFHELKRRYSGKNKSLALSGDLAEVAEKYAGLEIADSDIWKGFQASAHDAVRALDLLGGKQTHPILLAALEEFPPAETTKLLQNLVTLIVRYQSIGRGRTGRLEITAASVASNIFKGKHKSSAAASTELKAILPKDEEFRQDFEKHGDIKAAVARWMLRALEMQAWVESNKGKSPQLAPIPDPEKVNLEHVLPKNPGSDWSAITKADPNLVDECGNKLGNLCLLDKPSNKAKAAKPFPDKLAVYKGSSFLLTQDVAKAVIWNRISIEDRQKRLAALAVRVWKF